NGSTWSAVAGSPNGYVSSMTVFNDGGGPALFVGGEFSMVGSVAASCIAKWNGTAWSALGSGMNAFGQVYALKVYHDSVGPALFAGGKFTTAGGITVNHIARWNGSVWSA